MIFSNYDGGTLRINVDQNIPNLRIGIVSYEDDSVIISGAFSANVTKVVYAGYFNSSNIHCNPNIGVKAVYGVSSTIVTISFMPVATYSNPNGDANIICNYSCSTTTNQGGCNTPDQLVAYFNTQFAATNSNLLFHYTQYGCWGNNPYLISAGGNCCLVPTSTAEIKNKLIQSISLFPNPASTILYVESNVISSDNVQLEIYDVIGEQVYSENFSTNGTISKAINVDDLASGMYTVRLICGNEQVVKRVVIE